MVEPVEESVDRAEVVVISDPPEEAATLVLEVGMLLRVEALSPDADPLVAVAVADTSLVSSPGASDQGVVLRASDRVVVPVFDDGLDYGKC